MWERALTLRRFVPLTERACNLSHITSSSELIGQFWTNLLQLTISWARVIKEVKQKYATFYGFCSLKADCLAWLWQAFVAFNASLIEHLSNRSCSHQSDVRMMWPRKFMLIFSSPLLKPLPAAAVRFTAFDLFLSRHTGLFFLQSVEFGYTDQKTFLGTFWLHFPVAKLEMLHLNF